MRKNKIGQSTIEYIIVFAIVAGALILVAVMNRGNIQRACNQLSTAIQQKVGE